MSEFGVSSGPTPEISARGLCVLITGGTRGIGNGIAKVFVRGGASVVICGRDRSSGETVATEIEREGTGRCTFIECDVTKSADNERLVTSTIEVLGRVDCLVNNAGWHPPHRPIDEISVDEFAHVLRLNVVSYFELSKLTLPALREVRGSMINIGSLVGEIGQVEACDYAASKAAITGLTRGLAIDEARHGVRVNAILPGVVETPSHLQYLARQEDQARAQSEIDRWQWLGRIGQAEEIGTVCVFLASSGASFISGASINVTGGAELGYGTKSGWEAPAIVAEK